MAKKTVIELKELSTKSDNKAAKQVVTGFEETVAAIHKLDEQMNALQQERDTLYTTIMNRVDQEFRDNLDQGRVVKSYVISSSDDRDATVLYKNSYKKLEAENEPVMREVLGTFFDKLFDISTDTKLRKDASLVTLREVLRDRFNDFFTDTKYVSFTSDFMEKQANLRSGMSKSVVAMVTKWMHEHRSSPDFRTK